MVEQGRQAERESPARIGFLKGIVEELPGPIEPVESWIMKMTHVSDGEKEQLLQQGEPFVKAMLRMGMSWWIFATASSYTRGTAARRLI